MTTVSKVPATIYLDNLQLCDFEDVYTKGCSISIFFRREHVEGVIDQLEDHVKTYGWFSLGDLKLQIKQKMPSMSDAIYVDFPRDFSLGWDSISDLKLVPIWDGDKKLSKSPSRYSIILPAPKSID